MSEVIVITSGKGGVGKTTTSANIGCGLALAGKKTVLVDSDIGIAGAFAHVNSPPAVLPETTFRQLSVSLQ